MGVDVNEVYDTEGCEHCDDGFHGRIPIHEVLKINQKIRDALSDDAPKDVIRNLVYGEADVTTMLQDGLEKVLEGHTTFGEIVKLIELDDDSNTSFEQSIDETKTALAAQQNKISNSNISASTNDLSSTQFESNPFQNDTTESLFNNYSSNNGI